MQTLEGRSMTVLYFSWVKEKVGLSKETVMPPPKVNTVSKLIDWLVERSPGHAAAFADRKLIKSAIEQVHVDHNAQINNAHEIAFFPPVTGG